MGDEEPEQASARYAAFISYSHKDVAQARWLHRGLETYRVPRRLVGSDGEHGPVPARLTPIFRDREELPAAGDLTEKVRAALAASDNLVIVCSPDSAASPWVAREIEVFRELHPGRPILAAVVAGDPAQCFPAALRLKGPDGAMVEPLAADLRPEGDGRRLGLLKLVAGLAGVGLDALVQRDAARRVRRVMTVTLSSIAAMLAMAVLTILALNARAEAEHQRAEAEGLVEFMLTDLRDRLKGVGRLDVLTAVNRRALAHYEGQDLGELSADALERRARILHAMGEDDEKRGDLDRALAQFREASRTTAALLIAEPANPDRIYAHAQSEYWVGLIAWRTNDVAAAQAAFGRYAALAKKLTMIDPTNPDWLMEVGYAESNLGTLLLRERQQGRMAELRFAASLKSFRLAAARKPRDAGIAWDISDAHAWLADACRLQGRYEDALHHREQQAVMIRDLLAREPRNARFARGLLGNALGMAQIELDAGRYKTARTRLEEALAEAQSAAAADPQNKDLELQRIAIALFLAKATVASGADRQSLAPLLVNCLLEPARQDSELSEFCSILMRKERNAPLAASDEQQQHRYSPRWGIDFTRERMNLH